MGSLVEVVKDPSKRPAVVSDCEKLIQDEVSDKRGLTGMTVKGAFKMIQKFKPDIVSKAMDDLLDEFAEKIDPFWIECQKGGHNPEQFFSQKKSQIAESLLSITDERANNSKHRVLVKAYKSLRGKAIQHIGDAMPRFSSLVVKHAS